MNTDSPTSTDTAASTETEETNNHKRPHTSPRVKAFGEALAMIASQRASWDKDRAEGGDAEADAVCAALDFLAEKIQAVSDAGAPKPGQGPKSYRLACVAKDGTRSVKVVSSIGLAQLTELGKEFSAVYGPFHTLAGCEYMVANGPRVTDNRLL